MITKTLRSAVSKYGYEVREEEVRIVESDLPTIVQSCYSPKGDYLGDQKFTLKLIKEFGIQSFEAHKNSESRVVCMGYSPINKKWYGWSHRAIAGFGIGDKIFEESFGDDSTPFTQHGSITIETLEQAQWSAAEFARYVS